MEGRGGLGVVLGLFKHNTFIVNFISIINTSDHQALDPRGWGPLTESIREYSSPLG